MSHKHLAGVGLGHDDEKGAESDETKGVSDNKILDG